MKIAFLHYHLKPGGVTTVIRQQIQAVGGDCDTLAITGENCENPFPAKTAVIPKIAYDRPGEAPPKPEDAAEDILRAIKNIWPSGPDILHVHNPLFAKNQNLLKILTALQKKNVRLLLQVHDFAEDGRSRLYFQNDPYPADCHYCVINSRDYHYLSASGLRPAGLHQLPNMVTSFDLKPRKILAESYVLYPVRAIRRKNIGEAVLLSLFLKSGDALAVTLPPNSPGDWTIYNQWKNFVTKNRLKVVFEASSKHNFKDLVMSARAMITTSISEGFGFSYLEPWTAGQMLFGRRLPDLCNDFARQGVKLDHLYDNLLIPLECLDIEIFFNHWKACIVKNAKQFQINIPEQEIYEAFNRLLINQGIDFGLLDESFQQAVIYRAIQDKTLKSKVLTINPSLSETVSFIPREDLISLNHRIIATRFGEAEYRRRLLDIYQNVVRTEVQHHIDKSALARHFLKPDRFSLLVWSDPHAL